MRVARVVRAMRVVLRLGVDMAVQAVRVIVRVIRVVRLVRDNIQGGATAT